MNAIYLVGNPKKHADRVEEVVGLSLGKIREETNFSDPLSVVVFQAQGFYVIPELGITGSAIGREGISIKIDFDRADIKAAIEENLPATIFHEAAHIIWEQTNGDPKTLLDMVVSEGVACLVQEKLQPESSIPYIQPIKDEDQYLPRLKKEKDSTNYSWGEWFFGAGEYPQWLGYRLGYVLVSRYVREKSLPIKELVKVAQGDIEKVLQGERGIY